MTTKTNATAFNPEYVADAFWIVASEADADLIKDFCHGGAILTLDDGSALSNWNSPKGLGDWDAMPPLRDKPVYITFTAALRSSQKVKNLLKELTAFLTALGAKPYVVELPNGMTVPEALRGVSAANHKERIGEYIPAFQQHEEENEESTKLFETGHADLAYDIAESEFYFCRSENKEYFVLPKTSEYPNLAYMVGESDLRHILTRRFKQVSGGNVVGPQPLSAAMDTIAAECAVSPYKMDAKLRSARGTDGYYYMDLGTEDGTAVKFSAEGWELVSRIPNNLGFAFRRTDAIAALPVPAVIAPEDAEVTLRQFIRQFVNVSDEEWPLLVAYMVTHMIDGYKRPIMLLTSEAQSGKTTATAAVKFAVEGKMDRGAEIPTKADDIAVTVASQRMTVYNNVSNISAALSDFLCQVVDGSEYEKRKLRTDSDIVNLKLTSSVIVNGIDTGELRSDFKTRTVRLELKPVVGESMADAEIDDALLQAHPQILGSLLTLAVEALKRIPALDHPGNAFRMLDYTRVLMAIDDMWKLGGRCLQVYKHSLDNMSAEALDDPIFDHVSTKVLQRQNLASENVWLCEVGAKDLINDINTGTFGKAMESLAGVKHEGVKNTSVLTAKLNRAKTDWKRHGVTFENRGQERFNGTKQSVYVFRFEGAQWAEMVSAI